MSRSRFTSWTCLTAICLLLSGMALFAQQSSAQQGQTKRDAAKSSGADRREGKGDSKRATSKAKKTSGRSAVRKPVTPAQIKKVDTFVAANLPQLESLLEVLKTEQPQRYAAAIRELFGAADRLERMKQRDKDGYKLALKSWQLDKQAQLLAAQIRMDGSAPNEEKLRDLLEQRFDLELKILQRQRDRQAARLQKIDDSIRKFQATRDRALDNQVKSWLRKPAKPKVADSKGGKSSPKRTSTGVKGKGQ